MEAETENNSTILPQGEEGVQMDSSALQTQSSFEMDFTSTSGGETLAEQPSVISWGRSDFGGLLRKNEEDRRGGVSFLNHQGHTILAVSSNIYHTACITTAGELYTSGYNDEGQVSDDSSIEQLNRPRLLEALANQKVVSVSCGLHHTAVVTASGCAMSFGGNESGQLGHSAQKHSKVSPKVVNFSLPIPRRQAGGILNNRALIITKVSCGDLFSLFLTTTGEVYGCGSAIYLGNGYKAKGRTAEEIVHTAERIEGLVSCHIVDLVAGASHSLALSAANELYVWGNNQHCQLGLPHTATAPAGTAGSSTTNSSQHVQIPHLLASSQGSSGIKGRILGLSAGYGHSLFWTSEGRLYGAGYNKHGQLGGFLPRVDSFTAIEGIPYQVVMAACGYNHSLVLCNHQQLAVDSYSDSTAGSANNDQATAAIVAGGGLVRIPSISLTRPATATAEGEGSYSGGDSSQLNNSSQGNDCSHIYAFGSNIFHQVLPTEDDSSEEASSSLTIVRQPVEITARLQRAWQLGEILYIAAGGDQSFAIGVPQQAQQEQTQPKEQVKAGIGKEESNKGEAGKAAAGDAMVMTDEGGEPLKRMKPSPSSISSSSSSSLLLRKQFSTMASKAVVAMSCQQLLSLIHKATGIIPVDSFEQQRLVGICLATIGEIFSSPSLLAASFLPPPTNPIAAATVTGGGGSAAAVAAIAAGIDIEGLEACYTAMVRSTPLPSSASATASASTSLGQAAIPRLVGAIQQTLTELERAYPAATSSATSGTASALPETAIRVLLILWQAPIMGDAYLSSHLMLRLLALLGGREKSLVSSFIAWLSPAAVGQGQGQLGQLAYPAHIFATRLVKPLQEHLAYQITVERQQALQSSDPTASSSHTQIKVLCKALAWCYIINERWRRAAAGGTGGGGIAIPVEQFYNREVSSLPDGILVMDYIQWREKKHLPSLLQQQQQQGQRQGQRLHGYHGLSEEEAARLIDYNQPSSSTFYLSDYPYLISAEAKRRILLGEASLQQQAAQRHAVTAAVTQTMILQQMQQQQGQQGQGQGAASTGRTADATAVAAAPRGGSAQQVQPGSQSQSTQQQTPSQGQPQSQGQGQQQQVVVMPYFILAIERAHLLQQTLVHISHASAWEVKKPLKIIFLGEVGIDEGGLVREFFQLLVQQLFDPIYGMFQPIMHDRYLYLNRVNEWTSAEEYSLVGALLGLALYNGVLLDIHLPTIFYRKLLTEGRRQLQQQASKQQQGAVEGDKQQQHPQQQKEQTVAEQLEDLQSIDPELAQGLSQLLQYEPASDVEMIFNRYFLVEYEVFGEMKEVELIPHGKEIAVTGENRDLYVSRYITWLFHDSVAKQFEALYQGFMKVVPPSQLLLLTPQELELMMVGTPHLDFKELEQATEYIGEADWSKDHPTIRFFWQVVHQLLSFSEKQMLLKFITGSNKAPIGGLKNIGLKIQRMGPDSNNLPTAHTCFNTLLLPAYSSQEKLQDRLVKAIYECEGFGLK